MKIYFENNIILISGIDALRKYQIAQLKYYGFHNNVGEINIFQKESNNLELDISNILKFFLQENLSIVFSPEVESIVQRFNNQKEYFNQVLEEAKRIKNGIILNSEFNQLTTFLDTLPRKLKQHQIKCAYHLYSLKNSANFSVPGSGKTSVVLSVYEKLKLEGNCNILFVVGPPSCFQPWQNEFIETLGRNPEVTILSGGDKSNRISEYYKSVYDASELYLSTFQTISNDTEAVIKFFNQINLNVFLVIDEGHYIKQVGGSWASSLLKIGKYATFKCVLTGTPIPRSYKDVFNPFEFLWSKDFPLSEEDRIQIKLWEKQKKHDLIKSLLDEKIGPLFYRVRKKDLGLKPPVFHNPLIVQMNEFERKVYELVKAKIFELSQDDFFSNEEVLYKLWRGRLIRLRQAASYSKLLSTAVEEYNEELVNDTELARIIRDYDQLEVPAKLKALSKKVTELLKQGQKVVIWANFIGTLELIKKHFTNLDLKSELIYGKTPTRKDDLIEINEEKTREDIRDEFVDPESGLNILIANPAACAESISLHKTCFHAIYYDLSYNCAQYLQSLDRIHRVGGSEINVANYYFLQYENSIDQDIKANLDRKAQRMYDIIEQDYEIYNLNMFEDTEEDDIIAYKRLFHNS